MGQVSRDDLAWCLCLQVCSKVSAVFSSEGRTEGISTTRLDCISGGGGAVLDWDPRVLGGCWLQASLTSLRHGHHHMATGCLQSKQGHARQKGIHSLFVTSSEWQPTTLLCSLHWKWVSPCIAYSRGRGSPQPWVWGAGDHRGGSLTGCPPQLAIY